MRSVLPIGLACLAALVLVACETPLDPLPEPEPLEPQPDLLPLAVGMEWVIAYRDTSFFFEHASEGIDTFRVVDSYILDGDTWSIIEASGTGPLRSLFEGHYTNRDDGVWKWNHNAEGVGEPYLLYKMPGDSGEAYVMADENTNTTVTIADIGVPFETEAGTFESVRYVFDTDEGWGHPIAPGAARFDRILAPGVGFVRLEGGYLRLDESGYLVRMSKTEWTLVSFSGPQP